MKERTVNQAKNKLSNHAKVENTRLNKWRTTNNNMDTEYSERVKELEAENSRLKEDCNDIRLENDALKMAIEKKKISP